MNSQEAITLLKNLEDALNSYCELNEEGKTAFRMAITALNCSEIPNNWISCSERLPEGITQVIIQTNGEAIHEAIYMGKDDYGHYVWRRPDNEIYWNEEVVAWMPLPEHYRGD